MGINIEKLVEQLRTVTANCQKPLITQLINEFGNNPFVVLVGCLLSLRSRDTATIYVARELFGRSTTPETLLKISVGDLEALIRPIGFYRNKAATLRHVAQELLARFDGNVPKSEEALLSIKGIGRKTANLVLGRAFGIPAICVDVHVHRLSNWLGVVKTADVLATEYELKKVLPKRLWIEWNELLVTVGQQGLEPALTHLIR